LREKKAVIGTVEEDPEYKLIVQTNDLLVDLDAEISVVHKVRLDNSFYLATTLTITFQFIRDHYAAKFPELESLVLNPMDYARTVKAIGNEMVFSYKFIVQSVY
jgi:U4/U6 small nuclear ribonucleoprotein PRP31